jgi:DNA-binding Lrp family transcriptional regulator
LALRNKDEDDKKIDTTNRPGRVGEKNKAKFPKIDSTDIRILGLLTLGSNNKQISDELKIPLSTTQRRTRNIIQRGLVTNNFIPNYKQLGLKNGMIHVYLADGNMRSTAQKISEMNGITSVSVHVGNSDIVGEFVYEDSEQLVDILSSIKKLEGVNSAVWSEEVYVLPVGRQSITYAYHRMIGDDYAQSWFKKR